MPTYEYRCRKCGHDFEEFQQITAAPIERCPKCGKNSVERLIGTGAGIIFKGSGFYETDYKRSGGGKKPEKKPSGSSEGPASEGSGSGSGSAKPCEGCSRAESCPDAGKKE